jgi:hypothetical protein
LGCPVGFLGDDVNQGVAGFEVIRNIHFDFLSSPVLGIKKPPGVWIRTAAKVCA